MVRVFASIGGNGLGLTRSLIALAVDSPIARSVLYVYGIAQLPCSVYELSLPIDMWDGILMHVYYSRHDSTIRPLRWRSEWVS